MPSRAGIALCREAAAVLALVGTGNGLGAEFDYLQLVGKQMVGVYLSIWVKRALLRHVRGVQVTTVGTGIMGYLGNKGASIISLLSELKEVCKARFVGLCAACQPARAPLHTLM